MNSTTRLCLRIKNAEPVVMGLVFICTGLALMAAFGLISSVFSGFQRYELYLTLPGCALIIVIAPGAFFSPSIHYHSMRLWRKTTAWRRITR